MVCLVKNGLQPVPPLEVPHCVSTPVPTVPSVPPVPRYVGVCPMVDDIGVIMAFFSPAGFQKPVWNMKHTLSQLSACDARTLLVELTYGKELPVIGPPPGMMWAGLPCDSRMFHKENLWNIGAGLMRSHHPHIRKYVFLDGDVEFDNPQWLDDVSMLLDYEDVVQPFDKCVWLDDERRPYNTRISCAEAIQRGLPLDLRTQHPGFAWAMTSDAFDRIGGWYDKQVLGAGDTSLVLALAPDLPRQAVEPIFTAPSQVEWAKGVAAANLSVGFLDGTTLYHKYHGTHAKRQYNQRGQYMPQPGPDGELPLVRLPNGLLEWADPHHNELVHRYFQSREEDE